MFLALSFLWLSGARAACEDTDVEPWDTDIEMGVDCDGDGFTPADGDCDDQNPDVFPGRDEVCGDRIDNDCDGLYDGYCDDPYARGSLQGGASCGAGAGGTVAAAVLLWPLAWARRRRRR